MVEPTPDPPESQALPGPLPGRGFMESAGIAGSMLYVWCLAFAFLLEQGPTFAAVVATGIAVALGLAARYFRLSKGPDLGLLAETREALGLRSSVQVADGRYRAEGASEGRAFQLFAPGGPERHHVVRVPLGSDVRFALSAAGALRILGIREDLPQLGKTFNQRYRVETEDRERVAALLDHAELRPLLLRLFNLNKVAGVRAGDGHLDVYCAVQPLAGEVLQTKRLYMAVDGAARLASLLERRVIRVTGVERSLALSVEVDGGSRAICPYCRDDLVPDATATALEVCPRCHTAHHADCYAEAGGCTIYACAPPREAERERA